jgi:hypothetical protein
MRLRPSMKKFEVANVESAEIEIVQPFGYPINAYLNRCLLFANSRHADAFDIFSPDKSSLYLRTGRFPRVFFSKFKTMLSQPSRAHRSPLSPPVSSYSLMDSGGALVCATSSSSSGN